MSPQRASRPAIAAPMKAKLATTPFAPLVLLVVGAVEAPVLDPAGLVDVVVEAVLVPVLELEPVVVLLLAGVLNGMELVVVTEPVGEIPAEEIQK